MPRGPLPPKFAGRGPRPFGSFLGSGLAPAAINRYFRTNDELSYYSIPEVTFSSDFEIDLICAPSDDAIQMIMSRGGSSNHSIFISSGNIVFRDGAGSNTTTTGSPIVVNQINTIKIIKTGSAVSIIVNGSESGTGSSSSGISIGRLGARFTTEGFNLIGIIANVLMYDNGTLVRNYPINDNSNIIANAAASLGPELWSDAGFFTNATGSASGDSLVIESTSPFGSYEINGLSFQGAPSVVEFNVSGSIGNNVVLNVYDLSNTVDLPVAALRFGNGSHRVLTTIDELSRYQFRLENTGNQVTISGISIKQAPGYGSVVNGNASDWELFNQQADGDYLGQELISQSVWENPSLVQSEWSFSNNQWTIVSSGVLSQLILIPLVESPDVYRVSGNVVDFPIIGNGLAISENSTLVDAITQVGAYSVDINKSDKGGQLFKRQNGSMQATIDKPSVKRLLRVA